jgi:dihydroxyacid dehydratase/phosphogluconate dehydratase
VLNWPSGHLFGYSQNAGMGWNPAELGRREYLILSTQGGIRAPDGTPIALGYHTGHWEVGLLMEEASHELHRLGGIPFAAYCSDPCDGRTQGTTGMFDSLAYRNDAAIVLGRLIRSLPTRRGVMGVATCDKGMPAMMLALAEARQLPVVIVPGGVTLPPVDGEDAGKIQSTRSMTWAAGPAPLAGAGVSSWALPPPPRWWPRPWAWPCPIRLWPPLASRSGARWPGVRPGP